MTQPLGNPRRCSVHSLLKNAQPNGQTLVENKTVSRRGIAILKFNSLLAPKPVTKWVKHVSYLGAIILQ